jgi:hypothetical protein
VPPCPIIPLAVNSRAATGAFGRELISRGTVGLTVRLYGPHALGVQYTVSSRESSSPGVPDRHLSIQTVSIAYNFLGHARFGAVEWRGPE